MNPYASNSKDGSPPSYLALAVSWPVVRRAICFGVVVGSILAYINYSGCCFPIGPFHTKCVKKMLMTAAVPYMVSTISSVLALRQR